ncbi:hypothetical protein COLO4_13170, partial [Corchorus olitorius]
EDQGQTVGACHLVQIIAILLPFFRPLSIGTKFQVPSNGIHDISPAVIFLPNYVKSDK